jgi:predicted transcriptional regulator
MQVTLEVSDPKTAHFLQTASEEELRVMVEVASIVEPPREELLAAIDEGLAQIDRGETVSAEELFAEVDEIIAKAGHAKP